MWLAFQTLAPAGGSQLGATGYMSRGSEPTFGAGGSYAVRQQQRVAYRQAQEAYGVPGFGPGYGGFGGYGGYGYGGYGTDMAVLARNAAFRPPISNRQLVILHNRCEQA